MKPYILLTNDDGIHSPGLAALAQVMDPIGELLIVAPNEQQTSMSRSRTQKTGGDGTITKTTVKTETQSWPGYAVKATPALTVEHAVVELASRDISLVISGINFGENVGSCVTVSGTIGAAIEAAELGLPVLAVSQEIASVDYHTYSTDVNFSVSAHFTKLVAEKVLQGSLPFDADILKLEIPLGATEETKLVVTRQDRQRYYTPIIEDRSELFGTPTKVSYKPEKGSYSRRDTDSYAMAQGWVSITPLSLDLTSRIPLQELAEMLDISTLTTGDDYYGNNT
jgi:5'-nucleotidase